MSLKSLLMFAVFVLAAGVSQGHFIWVDVRDVGSSQQAAIYFSETPEPGEPHLIGRIGKTQLTLRTPDGQSVPIKTVEHSAPSMLVGNCTIAGPASIEADYEYGPYEHDSHKMHLHYYARRLVGPWWKEEASAVRSAKLTCDLVPRLDGDRLSLDVVFKQRPLADCEVSIVDPQGELRTAKTSPQGRITLDVAKPGRYAFRAGHTEPTTTADPPKAHYATLILEVPAAEARESLTAQDLLNRARDRRAMWTSFPGLSARLRITSEGEQVLGTVKIDADGGIALSMPESPLTEWTSEQLHSQLQHRLPDGAVASPDVRFVDQDTTHPLGRKISLGDGEQASAYRIRDDVILEVNRSMGDTHFTISVQDVYWNAEGKYLPTSFTMTFFDTATGNVQNTLTSRHDWQRVGKLDVPRRILEISTKNGRTVAREIEFEEVVLGQATQ